MTQANALAVRFVGGAAATMDGVPSGRARSDPSERPTDVDYLRLLELRSGLRRFLHWSEEQAQRQGLTPAQHQLLLAIRGHPDSRGPSVGQIADYLVVRHHSAVGLIDRAAAAGLVARSPDPDRPGTVRVTLTEQGRATLESLSKLHLAELNRLAPTMEALWRTLRGGAPGTGFSVGDADGEDAPAAG